MQPFLVSGRETIESNLSGGRLFPFGQEAGGSWVEDHSLPVRGPTTRAASRLLDQAEDDEERDGQKNPGEIAQPVVPGKERTSEEKESGPRS